MKRLLILSGKGGTGKTTTAAAFIAFSKSKAVADCDVDAPNLHIVSSLPPNPQITDFMGGDKAFIDSEKCVGCGKCIENCRFDAVYKDESGFKINENFCEGCGVCEYVCPQKAITLKKDVAGEKALYISDKVFSTARLKMGRGNSGKLVTEVKMNMLKNAPETDLAIVDGSPGIGCPVIASVSGMDLVLVVAEPSISGYSDLERLYKTISSFQTTMAVCVNKWDSNPQKAEEIERFCKKENIAFLGKMPYDKTASKAINQGKTVAEYDCPLKEALYDIYKKILELLNKA